MNYPTLTAALALSLVVVLLGHFGWLPPNVVSHVLAVLTGALLPTSALAAKKPAAEPQAATVSPNANVTPPGPDSSGSISPLLAAQENQKAKEEKK